MKAKDLSRALLALVLLGASVAPARADQALDDPSPQEIAAGRHVFDGAAALRGRAASPVEEAADAARGDGLPAPSRTAAGRRNSFVPALSRPSKAPQPRGPRIGDRLFNISWWMYHAAFAVDGTMTVIGIARGLGAESDPLGTLFGSRNIAGVAGSGIAVHLATSAFTLMLHHKAQKLDGLPRLLMEGTAIGLNMAGVAAHVCGALSWAPMF